METEQNHSVRALERGLEILSCFDKDTPQMKLTEISKKTGLSTTTVSRLLTTLTKTAFLQKDIQRNYSLGPSIYRLLELNNVHPDIRTVSLPFLENLRDIFNETASIYIRQNDVRVCLESIESKHPLRRTVTVGEILPLTRGAVGLVLLAWLPFDERQRILKDNPYIYENELSNIRQMGYCVNDAVQELGVYAIAAPIFNAKGQNIAAIAVSGPSSRIKPEGRTELIEAVKLNAILVSQKLGFKN